VVTLLQMAAKVGRATRLNILHRPLLTGQQTLLGAIGRTVATENLRHLQHQKTSARNSEVFHQLVERLSD